MQARLAVRTGFISLYFFFLSCHLHYYFMLMNWNKNVFLLILYFLFKYSIGTIRTDRCFQEMGAFLNHLSCSYRTLHWCSYVAPWIGWQRCCTTSRALCIVFSSLWSFVLKGDATSHVQRDERLLHSKCSVQRLCVQDEHSIEHGLPGVRVSAGHDDMWAVDARRRRILTLGPCPGQNENWCILICLQY